MAKNRRYNRDGKASLLFRLDSNVQDERAILDFLEPFRDVRKQKAVFVEAMTILIEHRGTVYDDPMLLQAVYERQAEILARITDLETRGISTASIQAPTTGKAITLGNIAMPTFDEENDEVIKKQDTQTDVNANFMDSLGALMGGNGNG